MSIIGDLIFLLRGDPKQLNVDVQKAGDKAGQTFGQRMSAGFKKSWSGAEIGKGLVQGLGLAGGLGAAALFTKAISTITNVLGDATQAALAEEVSIQKLGTALKANIPNWDGQTAAIEKVLKSRMRLGFSDDEQRESLALLVVATKDANKALAVQRVAMDLSRLKGISLKEASEALIKVEAGQFRALKALGIQLPKNATATQALAAVEKAAQGQAEDYAETNSGKLLVSQVEVGEAMEKFGAKTMPAMVEATRLGADAVTVLATGFDVLSGKMPKTADEAHEATDALRGMSDALGTLFPNLRLLGAAADEVDKSLETSMRGSVTSVEKLRGAAADDLGGVVRSMGTVEDASGDMAGEIKKDTRTATEAWGDLKDALVKDANDIIDLAFDPLIDKDRLAATNAEVAAARRILASGNASKAAIRDARETLNSAGKDQASYLLKLAEAGMTAGKSYKTGIASLKASIANASGPTKKYLQGVLDKIRELERVAKTIPVNFVVTGMGGMSGSGEGLHEGGPQQAGMPYWVGERGPEIHVPETNGMILSHAQSVAAVASGGGGTTTVNLTMPVQRTSDPFETATQLRRLADFGVLSPPPRFDR